MKDKTREQFDLKLTALSRELEKRSGERESVVLRMQFWNFTAPCPISSNGFWIYFSLSQP